MLVVTTTAKSYNFAYKYEDSNHPTAPTQIGHDHYTYDSNGNPTLVTNDSTNTTREMYWDEDNRLMVLSDNGKTSRYTYNAAGERIMKSYGTMEGVYINGAPQGITFHETDNFTLYPASILSVNKNRFTKHYFIGDKRVASRIGTGMFNNVYGRNGSYVTAGQQDYAERMNQIQTQKEAYYKKVGVAPGVPTEKGAYGDPENTGVGYNAVLTELGNHDVPQGWVQTPKPNTTPNTNPGPPVSWNAPSNTDDPQAGYGYIPNDTTKEETFFYHNDHLGSTSYITDDHANITQYDAYLPYGELLVDEHSSSEDLPYKFNGKQFDEETGLYYYGARYLNPMTSLWYGVDMYTELLNSISPYLYCSGNPIILRDKDGNFAGIPPGLLKKGVSLFRKAVGYIKSAFINGGVDAAVQTTVNVSQGQDLPDAVGNIDVTSVANAAFFSNTKFAKHASMVDAMITINVNGEIEGPQGPLDVYMNTPAGGKLRSTLTRPVEKVRRSFSHSSTRDMRHYKTSTKAVQKQLKQERKLATSARTRTLVRNMDKYFGGVQGGYVGQSFDNLIGNLWDAFTYRPSAPLKTPWGVNEARQDNTRIQKPLNIR